MISQLFDGRWYEQSDDHYRTPGRDAPKEIDRGEIYT